MRSQIWLLLLIFLSVSYGSAVSEAQIRVRPRERVEAVDGARLLGPRLIDRGDDELAAADDDEDEDEDRPTRGPLDNISDNLETLIKFEWNDGVLEPVFPETQQEIQQAVYAIRTASGGGGMSSSSSGPQSWRYQFQGQQLTGTFLRNWPRNRASNQLLIRLVELAEPYRELTISQPNEGSLAILLSGGQSPYILRARQKANGEFIAQFVNETIVHSAHTENFGQFSRTHVDFAQQELVPLLRSVGIRVPATPQDLEVQQVVMDRLLPIAEDRRATFDQLVEKLNAATFEERELASAEFAPYYEEYSDIVTQAIDDESYAPEIRTRLLSILKENIDESQVRIRDVASRLQLEQDVDYLVWLLNQRDDPAEQELISAQLTKLTEQPFGTDSEAWQDWLGENSESPELIQAPTPVDESLLTSEGQLVVMKDETIKLIQLTRIGDSLGIQREHWAAPFGGKTLSEITAEIKEEITSRGMPESFYNGIDEQRYPMLGFPHVLFENFYQVLRQRPQQGVNTSHISGSHLTANRQYTVNGLECAIATVPPNQGRGVVRGGNANTSKLFRLRLAETNAPRRSISIQEDEEERFRLEFSCEDADTIMRLIELPDEGGWILQDLKGVEVFASQGATFEDLYLSNQAYFDTEFFPLLENFGVELEQPE